MTTATSVKLANAPLGATPLAGGQWQFVLWAPNFREVKLHVLGSNERLIEMKAGERGYFSANVANLSAGDNYFYRLSDSRELPDPASRFQPEGVHGPSQLVDTEQFHWTDGNWDGPSLQQSIFYELHVGTFTSEGTFDAVIGQLDYLRTLGITTLELMPVAQFPGARNWGYDGAFPFAAQNTYGGPEGLQRLVNAAHERGLAVALDVVYNHLGPEGNYLGAYGPYFTGRYRTPWGEAINYDGAGSDEVRRFFIENALYWIRNFHIDALRLDAIHGIFDFSARHLLEELKCSVEELSRQLGRGIHLIAESDLNDSRILLPRERGGYQIDAQWSDDFHHSVHALLTGERTGYYQDFGAVWHLQQTIEHGWCYRGQYSQYRQRRHGNSADGISSSHFVVCNQNHDQVGNRAAGDRLSTLVDFEALKLAAGITLLSPLVPLLFMGEEYGEPAPFQYFTSHLDPKLGEAVRRGRQEEFASFGWQGSIPDPQDEATFERSRLQPALREQEPHSILLRFYRELIRVRKLHNLGEQNIWHVLECNNSTLLLLREEPNHPLAMLFNFMCEPVTADLPAWQGEWRRVVASADSEWRGPGTKLPEMLTFSKPFVLELHPHSFIVFESLSSDPEAH